METEEDLKKMQLEQMKDKDYLEKRAAVHAHVLGQITKKSERETLRIRVKFGIIIVAVLVLIGILFL